MNDLNCPVCGKKLTPKQAGKCLEEHYRGRKPSGEGAAAAIENYEFLENIEKGGEEKHV